jgi:hypothetical protein
MGIAPTLALLDLSVIKVSLSDTLLANVKIDPATIITFLGLLLMNFGLKPVCRK